MRRIIDTAERLSVNIAVKNMSRPEYLGRIFNNIQSERLGFLFDSGHCNVFTPDIDLLSLYGDKLMALHLHDNNGAEDWHSLLFSGNVNWTVSVLGKTASIAFVNPVRPSTQAIRISSVPRFRMLLITDVQNFALSFSPTRIPNTSRSPSILTPLLYIQPF